MEGSLTDLLAAVNGESSLGAIDEHFEDLEERTIGRAGSEDAQAVDETTGLIYAEVLFGSGYVSGYTTVFRALKEVAEYFASINQIIELGPSIRGRLESKVADARERIVKELRQGSSVFYELRNHRARLDAAMQFEPADEEERTSHQYRITWLRDKIKLYEEGRDAEQQEEANKRREERVGIWRRKTEKELIRDYRRYAEEHQRKLQDLIPSTLQRLPSRDLIREIGLNIGMGIAEGAGFSMQQVRGTPGEAEVPGVRPAPKPRDYYSEEDRDAVEGVVTAVLSAPDLGLPEGVSREELRNAFINPAGVLDIIAKHPDLLERTEREIDRKHFDYGVFWKV